MNTTSNDPVVLLDGGKHSIGATGSALFNVAGVNTDSSGLGTDQPIKGSSSNVFSTPSETEALNPIGALFKATNGADVDVTGNAICLDTALFETTLPIIELIGSASADTNSLQVSSFRTYSPPSPLAKTPGALMTKPT